MAENFRSFLVNIDARVALPARQSPLLLPSMTSVGWVRRTPLGATPDNTGAIHRGPLGSCSPLRDGLRCTLSPSLCVFRLPEHALRWKRTNSSGCYVPAGDTGLTEVDGCCLVLPINLLYSAAIAFQDRGASLS